MKTVGCTIILNVVVEWLVNTLLGIREVPGSNLGPDTDYPEVLRGFLQFLSGICWDST
jgi:hypothetical protein